METSLAADSVVALLDVLAPKDDAVERAGQIAMVEAVANALADRPHLVVEAGTGTGKSLAYLIPALLSGGQVAVATATKSLQNQLSDVELPFLAEHLGIPVTWYDISGVGAMIETYADNLNAEASQGSHFFHNITTLGLGYLTVTRNEKDLLDWPWLMAQSFEKETEFVRHVRFDRELLLKIDGRSSVAVGLKP